MPNTYTQLHIQLVFAIKYRAALIQKTWQQRLHEYMTAIFQHNDHKMLQINSMPDHIHIFIGMRPHQSISALVQNVKTESTKRIKENKFCNSAFLPLLVSHQKQHAIVGMRRWPCDLASNKSSFKYVHSTVVIRVQ